MDSQELDDGASRYVQPNMGKKLIRRASLFKATPWHLIAIITLSLVGASEILYATILGVAAYSDSTEYIVSARNLLAGLGLGLITPTGRFMPLYLHPPLYPLTLGAFGAPGLDLLQIARWLNAVLFGALVALVGINAWSLSRSAIVTVSVLMLLVTSPFLISTFTTAQAEPLFLVLGIASLMLVVRAANEERASLMIVAAALAGLSAVARYIGLVFVLVGAAFILVRSRNELKFGLRRALVYLSVGLVPTFLWLGYLEFAHSGISPRLFDPPEDLWSELAPFRIAFVDSTWNWFGLRSMAPGLPYRAKLAAILMSAVVLSIAFTARNWSFKTGKRTGDQNKATFPGFLIISIFSVAYLGLLAYTYAFYNPKPDLNMRIFSPYLLAGTAAILIALFSISLGERKRKWQVFLFALLVLGTVLNRISDTVSLVGGLHNGGGGYTGLGWQSSQTMEAVYSLDPSIPLISNEAAAIMLLTNRSPFEIPELESKVPSPLDLAFGDGDTRAERVFREDGAALVLFDNFKWEMSTIYSGSTSERLDGFTDNLFLFSDFSDGAIYFHVDPGGE